VHIVAIEAGNATLIYLGLHEVITLHAVLDRGTVGVVGECLFAELVLFEFPIVNEALARHEANRPIIRAAFDGIFQRTPFGMALHADVIGAHVIEPRRIHDIGARRRLDVIAAGPWHFSHPTFHSTRSCVVML